RSDPRPVQAARSAGPFSFASATHAAFAVAQLRTHVRSTGATAARDVVLASSSRAIARQAGYTAGPLVRAACAGPGAMRYASVRPTAPRRPARSVDGRVRRPSGASLPIDDGDRGTTCGQALDEGVHVSIGVESEYPAVGPVPSSKWARLELAHHEQAN